MYITRQSFVFVRIIMDDIKSVDYLIFTKKNSEYAI